jgi:hypothetical protein
MTSGNGTSEILTVLQKIEARLANVESAVVEGFRRVDDRFRDVHSRLGELTNEVRQSNVRLDRVIENTGAHWRTLDERVRKIEEHLGLAA